MGAVPGTAGASRGRVPAPTPTGALHVAHDVDIVPYLAAAGRGWGATVSAPSTAELLGEYLLHGLRLAKGVEAGPRWCTPSPAHLLAPLWDEWADRGLALPPGRRLALTPRGRLQLDRLALQAVAHVAAAQDAGVLQAAWPDGHG